MPKWYIDGNSMAAVFSQQIQMLSFASALWSIQAKHVQNGGQECRAAPGCASKYCSPQMMYGIRQRTHSITLADWFSSGM